MSPEISKKSTHTVVACNDDTNCFTFLAFSGTPLCSSRMFQRRGSHVPNRRFFVIENQPTPRALQIYLDMIPRLETAFNLYVLVKLEKHASRMLWHASKTPSHTHTRHRLPTTKEWVERPVVEVNFELPKQRQMGEGSFLRVL